MELDYEDIPETHVVQPLRTKEERDGAKAVATCGTCGLSWDDGISTGMTPAPSGRCPFEYFHVYEEDDDFEPHEAPDVHEIIADVLDSVKLAMESQGLGHRADDILATVEDYVANHYGED